MMNTHLAIELSPLQTIALVVGSFIVVAISVGALILTRMRIAKRINSTPGPAERIAAIKAKAAANTDLDARMAELLDTSQRLAAQLDNKAMMLELLIQQADERIAIMHDSSVVRARSDTTTAARPSSTSEPKSKSKSFNVVDHTDEHDHPAAEEADPQALADEVLRLTQQGYSTLEIAQRLDETIGNVELILALNK
ncbi:MAG: DUF6115 domain-containing protein [Phycisphaerales bacterium]